MAVTRDLARSIKTPGQRSKDALDAARNTGILRVVNSDPAATSADSVFARQAGYLPKIKEYDPSAALADSSAARLLRGDISGYRELHPAAPEKPKTAAQALHERVQAVEDQAKLDSYGTLEGKAALANGRTGSAKGKSYSPNERISYFLGKIMNEQERRKSEAPAPGKMKGDAAALYAALKPSTKTKLLPGTPEYSASLNVERAYQDSLGMANDVHDKFGDNVNFYDALTLTSKAKRFARTASAIKDPAKRKAFLGQVDPEITPLVERYLNGK
jgi:hypothetical protein